MADEILNLYYRGVVPTIGTDLYLRLLVAPSTRAGGGTETTYGGYARLALPRGTSIFSNSPANGRLVNAVVLTFGQATTVGNGDLVAFDTVDTASGAVNKIYNGGPIVPAKSVVVGKNPTFRISSLEITF